MRPTRLLAISVALLAVALLALPAAAYTIYLKDGSTITAEKKWEEVDGKAVITLPGGVRSTLDLDEIDVERSVRSNKENLGTATVIDGPNPRTEPAETRADPTLGDLIRNRENAGLDVGQPRAERQEAAPKRVATTAGGYPDLTTLERRPFGDLELAAELKRFFAAQGMDQAQIFQGSQAGRPMVEVITNSESSVFRALLVGASALANVHRKRPAADTLELLLVTPSRERAGQFTLTPQMAADLLTSRIDVSDFYLKNVQF